MFVFFFQRRERSTLPGVYRCARVIRQPFEKLFEWLRSDCVRHVQGNLIHNQLDSQGFFPASKYRFNKTFILEIVLTLI